MVLSVKKEKPVPLHHRKRQGQHHKRNKDYDKHYWPYLPLLAIAGLGFGLNILWTPLASVVKNDVLGYATNTSLAGLLDETNAQRSINGVGNLQLNSQLNQAAQAKAEDMATRNYWSHTTPDGKEPWWFVTNAGYNYSTVGENLAYGFVSSNATINGWMNSPGHRANMLNGAFADVGFGIANSIDYVSNGEQTIIVAMYGKSSAAAAAAPPAAKPSPSPVQVKSPVASAQPAVSDTATPAPVATAPVTNEPTAPNQQTTGPQAAPASSTISNPSDTTSQPERVTRLQTVAASVPAQGMASTILAVAAALALFVYRHTRAWHRRLVRGERFVVSHPFLDIVLVSAITLGALLTRTAGFIN